VTRPASGNRLAIGLLLCGTIWMMLVVFGLFRVTSVQFHAWVGFFVASGILAGSPIFTFAQSLPWMIRFIVAVIFLGCAFVFPWFYDQLPIYFWLTMLLAYVEVFGIVPSIPKRPTSKEERPHALQ
jgi:hypothetical protein